jgi:hypothetical protein
MLVMAIEDAKLSQQDLYKLQVDFSSAFNMTDHDITLQIMYDLGFPTDAIEVVEDIYTHATTAYKTLHGLTNKLTVDRGTLQGDTLSPFLFIVYNEPLLRWHVGGRGYKFGTIRDTAAKLRHACSSLAYADDLEILTQNLSDMPDEGQHWQNHYLRHTPCHCHDQTVRYSHCNRCKSACPAAREQNLSPGKTSDLPATPQTPSHTSG